MPPSGKVGHSMGATSWVESGSSHVSTVSSFTVKGDAAGLVDGHLGRQSLH